MLDTMHAARARSEGSSIPTDGTTQYRLIWLNIEAMHSKCFYGTGEVTYCDYSIHGEYDPSPPYLRGENDKRRFPVGLDRGTADWGNVPEELPLPPFFHFFFKHLY